jgi:hypothetical protein
MTRCELRACNCASINIKHTFQATEKKQQKKGAQPTVVGTLSECPRATQWSGDGGPPQRTHDSQACTLDAEYMPICPRPPRWLTALTRTIGTAVRETCENRRRSVWVGTCLVSVLIGPFLGIAMLGSVGLPVCFGAIAHLFAGLHGML